MIDKPTLDAIDSMIDSWLYVGWYRIDLSATLVMLAWIFCVVSLYFGVREWVKR